MVDSLVVPAWANRVLADLASADFAELVLLIVGDAPAEASRRGRVRSALRHGLLAAYTTVDRRVFRDANDALAPVDLSDAFPDVPRLSLAPTAGPVLETPAGGALDVILCLGEGATAEELAPFARHGAWGVYYGDEGSVDARPAALFWPVYAGRSISTAVVACRRAGDGEAARAAHVSFSSTDPISLYRNQNRLHWKAAYVLVQRLRALRKRGEGYLDELPRVPFPQRPARRPSSGQVIAHSLRILARVIARRLRTWLWWEQWFIAYRRRQTTGGDIPSTAGDFVPIPPPAKTFFADPFLIEQDGRHYAFFEEYSSGTNKGFISYVEIADGRHVGPKRVALQGDHHLSYPFVFSQDGAVYMLPETRDKRTVELYRARRFPDEWSLERILLSDISAVDPTLLWDDGRFWLFLNVAVPGTRVSEDLFLYWAESLSAQWTPHSMNPVISDTRCARPAGRIFRHGDAWVRPGQDCSRAYGSAVVFNRIDVLTEDEYRETEIGRFGTDWIERNIGTHSYNFDSRYEIVDGRRSRLRLVPGAVGAHERG